MLFHFEEKYDIRLIDMRLIKMFVLNVSNNRLIIEFKMFLNFHNNDL